jgi:hypothetical protein
MADSEEKPPEQKPTPTQEALEELSWEIPFVRTIKPFFIKEGKAVKSGWVAVIVIICIAVFFTHHFTVNGIDVEISNLTNSFNGQISELKGQLADAKQDRDKYQMMLAPFQAMAIAKYTNAPMDQRLDLLANEMSVITNVLAGLKLAGLKFEKPSFIFFLNGKQVTNDSIITLPKDRKIIFTIVNKGNITAENLTADFSAPTDATNVDSPGWSEQNSIVNSKTMQKIEEFSHWTVVSDHSVAPPNGFTTPPLILSKNLSDSYVTIGKLKKVGFYFPGIENLPDDFIYPYFPVHIEAYSDNSERQDFVVLIRF